MSTAMVRIPVTNGLPVEVLRPELRACLDNLLPTVQTEKTRHQFVRDLLQFQVVAQRRNAAPLQTDRTRYGGALTIAPFFDRMGVFNPEKYPVKIIDKMRDDPMIYLGTAGMINTLRGLDWTIECAAPEQKRFLEFAIRRIYPELMRTLSMALYYGFSSNELIWEGRPVTIADMDPKTGRRKVYYNRYSFLIKKIKDHAPSSIRAVLHPRTEEFLGIAQMNMLGEYVYLKKGPKLLFFGFDQENGNVFGRTRLAGAYKPWYWHEVFQHYLGRYMERRGTPPIVVRHPRGKRIVGGQEVEAGDIALKLGMALLENAVVALPSEFDGAKNQLWDIGYVNDDKRADMFAAILNYYDVLKTRGLGIPDRAMTQDLTPGGTSAGSEASRDLFLVMLSSMIQQIQKTIQDEVVDVLHTANFLEQNRVSARFIFQSPEVQRISILKELAVEEMRLTPSYLKYGLLPKRVFSPADLGRLIGAPTLSSSDAFERIAVPAPSPSDSAGGGNAPPPSDAGPAKDTMSPKESDKAAAATQKEGKIK